MSKNRSFQGPFNLFLKLAFCAGLLVVLRTPPIAAEELPDKLIEESQNANPKELFSLLNRGWSKSYKNIESALNPAKSYLTISSTEPSSIMDLRSADHFRQSVISAVIGGDDVDIGHVWVGWKCKLSNGVLQGMAGQAGNQKDQFMDLVKAGWGLSAFKSHFLDGYLETPEIIERDDISDEMALHTMVVEVDSQVCQNAARFVWKYISHPSAPQRRYGLEGLPSSFSGGGCGSFGVTVLEESKLFETEKRREDSPLSQGFWRTISSNADLFGFGLKHASDVSPFQLRSEGTRSISMMKVLMSNWNGKTNEDLQLKVMDPEMLNLMFKTIYREKLAEIEASGGERIRQIFSKSGVGNLLNYRQTVAAPVVVIDENFDANAQQVVQQTREWLKSKVSKVQILWLRSQPAILIEK